MPRKKAKKTGSVQKRRVKPTTKKVIKPKIKKSISLRSAEIVKIQNEFDKIEEEIMKHIASRAPKIPFAKPQTVSNTYFASEEERLEAFKTSLKKIKE